MNPHDAAPVLPGETLAGKYRVERVLGRGGMGIVVAARHLELEERVAIKFLLRKDDPIAVERFLREARAAAKVKNEHVCRVYDVARLDTGEPYLVMEYLDGVDLSERLRGEGRLPVADVARWMIEACAALADAHALGIVHRDLKPANLFLAKRSDETSTVKVLDFGISKLPSSDGMTSTTALMGTPIYMSPEQVASARDVDHRTDIWSLGVIMYELVSGKPPFSGDSLIQLSVKIRETELPPLASGIAELDDVVAKCLAKDREARWSSVGDLAAALAPFAGGAASTDLARRVSRTLTTANPALAETTPDEVPAPPAAAPVGQATLEPLSTAKVADAPRSKPWPGAAIALVVVAAAGIGLAVKVAGRDSAAPTVTPTLTADVAVPPLSASANVVLPPDPLPPAPSTFAQVAASSSPLPSAKPAKARLPDVIVAVDAGVAAAPTSTPSSPTPSAVPEETTGAKKKRSLDRDDPYAR